MPTATLGELLDEVAATLLAVVGPAVSEVEVQVTSRRNLNPTPPAIDVYPAPTFRSSPDEAGFGDIHGGLMLTVRVRVNTVDPIAGQDLLLRFMDEEDDISVAGTLMEDQTLNGLATSVFIEGNTGMAPYAGDSGTETALWGCEWLVRILRAYS